MLEKYENITVITCYYVCTYIGLLNTVTHNMVSNCFNFGYKKENRGFGNGSNLGFNLAGNKFRLATYHLYVIFY